MLQRTLKDNAQSVQSSRQLTFHRAGRLRLQHHQQVCPGCRACQNPDGSEDLKKGTQLLEVYALEIQMYTEQKDTKRLKQLYQKALTVKSAIPHPRIMGIIRECGGKMHMHERIWSEAATDFFEVSSVVSMPQLHFTALSCIKYPFIYIVLLLWLPRATWV